MQRTRFAAFGLCVLLLIPFVSRAGAPSAPAALAYLAPSAGQRRITHAWTDTTAIIGVEGLKSPVRVLHVTDAHLVLLDKRDQEYESATESHRLLFRTIRHDDNGKPVPADVSFDRILDRADPDRLSLIALTGDIVHFPSAANVNHVASQLRQTRVPWLYVSGNQDWHFPGREGREELRDDFNPRLIPLTEGRPACNARTLGGLRFVTIDNSTYQVSQEQLAFVRKELAAGAPVVLLMHIPLSLPALRAETIRKWKSPLLMADPRWDAASRAQWDAEEEDRPPTLELARLLRTAPNLVAVLCGHVNFAQAEPLSPWAVQYVGKPAYEGGQRLLEFRPLP